MGLSGNWGRTPHPKAIFWGFPTIQSPNWWICWNACFHQRRCLSFSSQQIQDMASRQLTRQVSRLQCQRRVAALCSKRPKVFALSSFLFRVFEHGGRYPNIQSSQGQFGSIWDNPNVREKSIGMGPKFMLWEALDLCHPNFRAWELLCPSTHCVKSIVFFWKKQNVVGS